MYLIYRSIDTYKYWADPIYTEYIVLCGAIVWVSGIFFAKKFFLILFFRWAFLYER
jgi:hypothetical protein